MTLDWPWALLLLFAVPVLAGFWWWMRARRRRAVVRLPSVALIRTALPGRSLRRRRIAVALFGTGLAVVGFAAARPQASVAVPVESSSIMLALDVSGSMCTTDVLPNRLAAAQQAAGEFIAAQEGPIGLVGFAGFASLLVEPTTQDARLTDAIGELKTGRGTAIGMAISVALDAISEHNPAVAPTGVELADAAAPAPQPDVIVVLTDGANTRGITPQDAARLAVQRGVRIYTIGFGTSAAAPLVCDPTQLTPDSLTPRQGWAQEIEEGTLQDVARITGGEYHHAVDGTELTRVLLDLPKVVRLQTQQVEVTHWFVLAGGLLVMAGVFLSLWWNRPRQLRTASMPE